MYDRSLSTRRSYALETKQWGTEDFLQHYAFGKGRAVDLEDIGLLDDFRRHPSVRRAVGAFRRDVRERIMRDAVAVCRRTDRLRQERWQHKDTTVTDITNGGDLYSIGNSTFFRSGRGSLKINCKNNHIEAEGVLTFEIRDAFKEPLNVAGFELATPYPITARWTERFQFRTGI